MWKGIGLCNRTDWAAMLWFSLFQKRCGCTVGYHASYIRHTCWDTGWQERDRGCCNRFLYQWTRLRDCQSGLDHLQLAITTAPTNTTFFSSSLAIGSLYKVKVKWHPIAMSVPCLLSRAARSFTLLGASGVLLHRFRVLCPCSITRWVEFHLEYVEYCCGQVAVHHSHCCGLGESSDWLCSYYTFATSFPTPEPPYTQNYSPVFRLWFT